VFLFSSLNPKKVVMRNLILFLFIFFTNSSFGQNFLNLDFEVLKRGGEVPKNWYVGTNGYEVKAVSDKSRNGEYCLSIKSLNSNPDLFGVSTMNPPIDNFKDKNIELRGWIKTENVVDGYAGFWFRVDGPDRSLLGFDNMNDRGVIGSSDWRQFSINMKIDSSLLSISFGCMLTGKGQAWFDDIEIYIEGQKYNDIIPKIYGPTPERLKWLKQYIYPIATCDPNFDSDTDLHFLDDLIEDKRVLALGEVTHGSRDIFLMKHRLIKYLAQHKSFDLFSIEANLPESYRINEYTVDDTGMPRNLLSGLHFWTWNTESILGMIEWMNQQNKTSKKIKFTGFDMQYFEESISILENAFIADQNLVSEVKELGLLLDSLKSVAAKTRGSIPQGFDKTSINQIILRIKMELSQGSYSDENREWLYRNLRIIEQFLDMTYFSRDKYMAENFEWILNQNQNSKATIWAHNEHIKESGSTSMGSHLNRSLGEDYLTVGFAFHKGSYSAYGDKGLSHYEAEESYLGSFEYICQAIDEPYFLVNLKKIKEEDSANANWLKQKIEFRSVGALNPKSEFYETNLLDDYDFLVFINESNHSLLLK